MICHNANPETLIKRLKIMGLLNFLGALSPAHINWVTLTSGATLVGRDGQGNRYYRAKARKGYKRERRWVLYKGEAEASRVPPEWHGWLHCTTDTPPTDRPFAEPHEWQLGHQPNLTGSARAYLPPGHPARAGGRAPSTSDYEPWVP